MLTMMEGRMQTVRRLLDDLLDISRITEGKIALKKESIDIETIMRRAIVSTAHHRKERHQSLAFEVPLEPLRIHGDPVRIEQVFSNILTNASKYSDPGDEIKILMKKLDRVAEVIVSDEGVGIEGQVLEKIFNPFQQADLGTRNKRGLGIGLALVRGFVEMHGGSVVATSAGAGRGSQFTVTLPLVSESESSSASLESGISTSVSAKSTQELRVLIVDDMDIAASSMGKLLELKGCTVFYAYNGRQAVGEATNVSPDIILLDIGLPDLDGYTVAKAIRARGFCGRLIALTVHSTEDARIKGKDAGFEHYLVKPADLADLTRVIPELS